MSAFARPKSSPEFIDIQNTVIRKLIEAPPRSNRRIDAQLTYHMDEDGQPVIQLVVCEVHLKNADTATLKTPAKRKAEDDPEEGQQLCDSEREEEGGQAQGTRDVPDAAGGEEKVETD